MANNLRIAIVCSYYPWSPGGVETIVRQNSVELARRGYEIHVITTPYNALTKNCISSYGIEERSNVFIHKLKPFKLRIGYAWLLNGLRDVISKVRPDIVHSHNLHPHLFELARWKRRMNYKLIAELHYPVVNLESIPAKIAFPFALKYLARISHAIDSFIVHTELERNWLIKNGIPLDKVHKIMFPCVPPDISRYLDVKVQRTKDLLFIGRVVQIKGLHILIRALKSIREKYGKQVSLTIAGPADKRYFSYLKKMVNELRLNDQVVFKGIISEPEKYINFLTHKIFVLPTLGDYTPNVLLEAQSLGMPVIASKVGAIPEMVIQNKTGLLTNPGSVEELADAIKTLLFDNYLREKMSLSAKEYSKKFAFENSIKSLEELYHGISSS